MKVDIRPRLCGKTKDIILKSAAEGIPIVCPTARDMDRIIQTAKNLGVHIPCPIPLISANKLLGYSDVCYVDDADRILTMIIMPQIKEATLTEES